MVFYLIKQYFCHKADNNMNIWKMGEQRKNGEREEKKRYEKPKTQENTK